LYFAHNSAHEYKQHNTTQHHFFRKKNISESQQSSRDESKGGSNLSARQISLVADHTFLNQEKSPQNLVSLCFSKEDVAGVLSTKF